MVRVYTIDDPHDHRKLQRTNCFCVMIRSTKHYDMAHISTYDFIILSQISARTGKQIINNLNTQFTYGYILYGNARKI